MKTTSEVYERLYHYTTWDGLRGILRDKTLWATHCRFLNDYSEIILFRDKLVSFLLPHAREKYEEAGRQSARARQKIDREGGPGQFVQHDTEKFVEGMYKATGDEIYISSFCGEHKNPYINSNGLLSQWRGYGAGGGFALVFNTRKLEEKLKIERKAFAYDVMHLSDVVYSGNEDRLKEELSADLSILADGMKQLFDYFLGRGKPSEKEGPDILKDCHGPFVKCISRYKHCGFGEENEVRLVALPTVFNQKYLELASSEGATLAPEKERKFRDRNGELVPYIELFNSLDMDLPIERIIVGPHKEKEARAAALRVMLRNTEIEITCSDIPFVG